MIEKPVHTACQSIPCVFPYFLSGAQAQRCNGFRGLTRCLCSST